MRKLPAWAYLPSAHNIDRILADRKNRPQMWDADHSKDVAYHQAAVAARRAVQGQVVINAWHAAWGAAFVLARDKAEWDVARGALLALVAWDDAGVILDMPPDAIRLLAASGHHPAVLLLPAAVALATTT